MNTIITFTISIRVVGKVPHSTHNLYLELDGDGANCLPRVPIVSMAIPWHPVDSDREGAHNTMYDTPHPKCLGQYKL